MHRPYQHCYRAWTAFMLFLTVLLVADPAASVPPEDDAPEEKTLEVTISPLSEKNGAIDGREWQSVKTLSLEDYGSSIIILSDGSMVTLRDWVVGGLTKNKIDGAMTDLQNRQFLGQTARDLMLHEEHSNIGQPLPVGPLMPGLLQEFSPVPLKPELALMKGLICQIACYQPDLSTAIFGGTNDAYQITAPAFVGGHGDSHGFRNQFARALNIAYPEWKKRQFFDKKRKEIEAELALRSQQ